MQFIQRSFYSLLKILNSRKYITLLLLILTSLVQSQNKKILNITKAKKPPKIDAFANDPAWKNAEEAKDFVQFRPAMGLKEKEHQKTVVKMAYDDNAVYFLAYLHDKPEDILKLTVKNDVGEMVPLSAFMDIEKVYGVDQITRYNMYPSAELNGEAKAGYSTIGFDTQDKKVQWVNEGHNYINDIINNSSITKRVKIELEKISKTPNGQSQLLKMWKAVHGCGKGVSTLITNKKTSKSQLKSRK